MSNPVNRYKELLIQAGIIEDSKLVLVEPTLKQLERFDISIHDLIVLQQGMPIWYYKQKVITDRIKEVLTPNMFVYKSLKDYVPIHLIEFPILDMYQKKTSLNDRETAVYYNGRILPGKMPLEELEYAVKKGLPIVLRGPICKMYWEDEYVEGKEYDIYRSRVQELIDAKKVEYLEETEDPEVIIDDLNRYKFYFTLSNGEAFNLALQEAIACGTIPLVKNNGAYWWAHDLYVGFNDYKSLVKYYEMYKDKDLEEYSDMIAKEIKERCSLEAISKSFELSNKE